MMLLDYWLGKYSDIAKDLGLDVEEDRRASRILSELLGNDVCFPGDIALLMRSREVVIFGPATISGRAYEGRVIIAAGTPNPEMLRMGLAPDMLVTDLDGDINLQLECNMAGAIAVIHGHGDNIDLLRKWVPEFVPPRMGTTQTEPLMNVHNFGGFTDGDRAVVMAAYFGARRIILEGFNLDKPVEKEPPSPLKEKKLAIARDIIEGVSRDCDVEFADSVSR